MVEFHKIFSNQFLSKWNISLIIAHNLIMCHMIKLLKLQITVHSILLYFHLWTHKNIAIESFYECKTLVDLWWYAEVNAHLPFQVAVNSLLGDTPTLVDYGTALMSNLATKEVKAVVRYHFIYLSSLINPYHFFIF